MPDRQDKCWFVEQQTWQCLTIVADIPNIAYWESLLFCILQWLSTTQRKYQLMHYIRYGIQWEWFLRKVIPDHLQSCEMLLDCWWLTVIFTLSTRLQNCNADYLRYQFNSEACRRCYLIDAMVLSFNRMALQLVVHATQDWLHTTAMILLQSMNGHQTRQILINMLDYHVWGAMLKAYHKLDMLDINNQGASNKTRDDLEWWPSSETSERAVQNFRKRLQACVFKAGGHF